MRNPGSSQPDGPPPEPGPGFRGDRDHGPASELKSWSQPGLNEVSDIGVNFEDMLSFCTKHF